MARAYQVSISSTKAVVADKTLAGGGDIIISNPTGQLSDVYLGGEGNETPGPGQTVNTVSSTTGYLLKVGTSIGPIRLSGSEAIYAIANTATTIVHVFRVEGRP